MPRPAQFRIISTTPAFILIDDVGPHDQHLSVTNDAEGVVKRLVPILAGRRLFCRDTAGDVDEVVIEDGKFGGFLPDRGALQDLLEEKQSLGSRI